MKPVLICCTLVLLIAAGMLAIDKASIDLANSYTQSIHHVFTNPTHEREFSSAGQLGY